LRKSKKPKCLILLNSKSICWINYFIFCSILGNRGPNLVGKDKYKECMWERRETETNLLCLVPYTVVVAPAACGQWDPCLNMAGNASPSIRPPIPFSFFLGSSGTGHKWKVVCFACQKDYQNSRTSSNHAKKSPLRAHANYWLWRARICAKKPVNCLLGLDLFVAFCSVASQ